MIYTLSPYVSYWSGPSGVRILSCPNGPLLTNFVRMLDPCGPAHKTGYPYGLRSYRMNSTSIKSHFLNPHSLCCDNFSMPPPKFLCATPFPSPEALHIQLFAWVKAIQAEPELGERLHRIYILPDPAGSSTLYGKLMLTNTLQKSQRRVHKARDG